MFLQVPWLLAKVKDVPAQPATRLVFNEAYGGSWPAYFLNAQSSLFISWTGTFARTLPKGFSTLACVLLQTSEAGLDLTFGRGKGGPLVGRCRLRWALPARLQGLMMGLKSELG